MHRDAIEPELLCCLETGVSRNDDAVIIDDDRLPPAERLDRSRDLVDRHIRDNPRVLLIGPDAIECPPFDGERLALGHDLSPASGARLFLGGKNW